VNETDR